MRGILSSLQIVPHEYRERVLHYVQERLATLPYINEAGEEIMPPEAPRVPFPDRDRSSRELPSTETHNQEDRSGG